MLSYALQVAKVSAVGRWPGEEGAVGGAGGEVDGAGGEVDGQEGEVGGAGDVGRWMGQEERWVGQEGSGERLWSVSAAVPESAYQ